MTNTELRNLQRQFPPTFTKLIEILLNEARQSDYLESHWYHVYGEILFALTRAASTPEIVFSVAAQRTFTFVPSKFVVNDQADRPKTRLLQLSGEESDEDMEEDAADMEIIAQFRIDEQDALMEAADDALQSIFGDNPDASGSTATTGYSEGATPRTPDFAVYLHNFKDKTNIPVMIVEDKPTPQPQTIKGKLLSMKGGSYEDQRTAALVKMDTHREQRKEQLTHLFDEYRNLCFVYYCLTIGEWFRIYRVDREKFLTGRRQHPPSQIKPMWNNGSLDPSMLEPFIGITEPGKFYHQ